MIWWSGDWSGKRGGSSRNGNFVPQGHFLWVSEAVNRFAVNTVTVPWLLYRVEVSRESETPDIRIKPSNRPTESSVQ